MKDAIDILKQWLSEHGWDGLSSPYLECGCSIDDFAPCGDIPSGCFPAKGNCEDGFFTVADAEEAPLTPAPDAIGPARDRRIVLAGRTCTRDLVAGLIICQREEET